MEVTEEQVFKQWGISQNDRAIIKEVRENGNAIVCLPCSKYSLQVVAKGKKIANIKHGVVKPYAGNSGKTASWNYHRQTQDHTECCRRHFEKNKKWPTDSVASPTIKRFFSTVKQSNNQEQNANGNNAKRIRVMLPFWRLACNGIIPIMQLIDKCYKNSDTNRNIQLREAIKTNHLYFLPTDTIKTGCIGESEVLSIFSISCEGDWYV